MGKDRVDAKTPAETVKSLKMRGALLLIPCMMMLAAQWSQGQACDRVHGAVIDQATGQSLPGAHVRTTSNWKTGTSTDADGKFNIIVAPADTLIVSFIGYGTQSFPLATFPECDITLVLTATSRTMDDITITAPRLVVEEFRTSEIRKLDIYLNPASKADPLLAVSTLPSATTLDESANVSLRGSTAAETGVFINNIPVYDAIRYSQLNGIGTFSIFNTAIIDQVQVFPGNPPLEFGNTTSGLIALETDANRPSSGSTQLALSLASLGGTFHSPVGKKTGISLFANYQPSALIKGMNRTALADIRRFNSIDGGVHITHSFRNKAQLRIYNYALSESYTFHYRHPTYDGDFSQAKKRNLTILNLHQRKGSSEFSFNQGWNISGADYRYSSSWINLQQQDFYSSVNYRYFGYKFDVKTGMSHDNRSSAFDGTFPQFEYAIGEHHPVVSDRGHARLKLTEAYVYGKYRPASWLTIGQGVRAILPGDRPVLAWSYQTNIRTDLSESMYMLFATGKYHQTIFGQSEHGEKVSSTQQSLDMVYHHGHVEASASAFHKRVFRTGNTKKVTGAEFYLKYSHGRKIQGQVSFTTLHAEANDGVVTFRDQYDIRYFMRTNLQYGFNQKWSASAIVLIRQGSFVLPVAAAGYDAKVNAYKPVYASRDLAERLPDYRSLSLAISRMTAVSDKVAAVFFLSVSNVLNHDNIRGYFYSGDYSKRTPSMFSARTVYFGMVFYF